MRGKEKCKILKEIRAEIARNNDIEWVTSECTHKGECKGTCPKCEAEVQKLEREIAAKKRLGQTVAVAGVAVGVALTSTGCGVLDLINQFLPTPENEILDGDVEYIPESFEGETEDCSIVELEGEVAVDADGNVFVE